MNDPENLKWNFLQRSFGTTTRKSLWKLLERNPLCSNFSSPYALKNWFGFSNRKKDEAFHILWINASNSMFSVRETDICSSVAAWQRPQKCLDSLWPIRYPYLSHITLAGTVNTAGGQSNELCLVSLKFISSMLVVLASWCVQQQRSRTTISRPERNLPAWRWQIKVLPPPAEWWALKQY